MKHVIEVENVTKRFGGLRALNDVGLKVAGKEIIGLIGPNGAGKTTLFNVICGYLKPDKGKVLFNGRNITGLPPYTICEIGIVRTFQVARPFRKLTVFENVVIGALLRSKSFNEAKQKALTILKLLGMEDFRNLRAEQLGVVYQKRLELAKALTTDPKVILIDECMAGLKPEEIEALKKLLHEIRNNGVSMIVVEHVIRGLIGLCDRVVVLHHGEKIAEGNPHEIIKAPEVKKAYLGEEYAAA